MISEYLYNLSGFIGYLYDVKMGVFKIEFDVRTKDYTM